MDDYSRIKLYHMTEFNNLSLILSSGKLISNRFIQNEKIKNTSIAHQSIQDRRECTKILFSPGGTLHDYVPFYFAPRSPMLYAIHMNNVKTYSGNESRIVYLCTNVQQVLDNSYKYVFTDGHAVMEYTQQYNDITDLMGAIDWEIMKATYWNGVPDGTRRRQAEFLIYNVFYIQHLTEIAVKDSFMQKAVKNVLNDTGYSSIKVYVRPNWYF